MIVSRAEGWETNEQGLWKLEGSVPDMDMIAYALGPFGLTLDGHLFRTMNLVPDELAVPKDTERESPRVLGRLGPKLSQETVETGTVWDARRVSSLSFWRGLERALDELTIQ